MSSSDYYRKRAITTVEKKKLEIEVIHCFDLHKSCYGRIRIKKELDSKYKKAFNLPFPASEHKISRILKDHGRYAKTGRKSRKKTNKPVESVSINENLIALNFKEYKTNELWCADISEIKCKGAKIYVSGIIDVGTRRIVGWDIKTHMRQDIVHNAFDMATGRNPKRPIKAIFHSDRGCQYTSKLTTAMIAQNCFKKSMSKASSPNDNQIIESFWKTLKLELGSLKMYTAKEATLKIISFIELEYNSSRLHSGIGYMTPNEKYAQEA